jgi:hypothetical protein
MAQAMWKCPDCGAGLGPNMAFCPSCGTKFATPTPAAPPAPVTPTYPPQAPSYAYSQPPQYQQPQQSGPSLGGSITQGFGWGCGCLLVLVAIFLILVLMVHH